MKKTFFYIGCLVLLVAGCNKVETEVTPVEEPAVESTRHLTVDINVEYPGDTRSLKTGWEEGDKIYVAFDHYFSDVLKPASGTYYTSETAYYMTLTYTGNSWASEFTDDALENYLLETVEGQGRTGILSAVYFSDLKPQFQYSFQEAGAVDYYRLDFLNGKGAPGFFLTNNTKQDEDDAVKTYSVVDDKLTATLRMRIPDNMVHFFLEGVGPEDYQRFSLKCSHIAPGNLSSFFRMRVHWEGDEPGEEYLPPYAIFWDWRDRYGEAIPAAKRSDGIAFCGLLKNITDQNNNLIETVVGQEAEYFIQVIDNNGTPDDSSDDIIYTLTKTATLNSKDAVKLPALDSGRWVDYQGADNVPIQFASDAVKAIAVAKWDTSRDGELSYAEAAAVESLDYAFNESLSAGTQFTFDELKYFTNLKRIEDDEFYYLMGLEHIELPSSLIYIGDRAFAMTDLKEISIPEGVETIGSFAFAYTSLQSFNLPASVNAFDGSAFVMCDLLSEITVDAENAKFYSPSGSNAIMYRSDPSLVVGCSTIPEGTIVIGPYAFSGRNITSIKIPATVHVIGESAFFICPLESVYDFATEPQTLVSEGGFAVDVFGHSGDTYPIYVPAQSVDAYKEAWPDYADRIFADLSFPIVFASDVVKEIAVNNWDTDHDGELSYAEAAAVTSLGGVFKSIPSSTEFTFDELQYFTGLTSIGDHEFESTSMTSVILPPTIKSIGYSAFGYTKITSIVIPEGVTEFSHFVFMDTPLKSLHIPASLTFMLNSPVTHCANLSSITVSEDNPVYASPNGCNAIIVKATNTLFAGCSSTVIPETVTSIGGNAFIGAKNLKSIEISGTVKEIGSFAFAYSGLQSVGIEYGVETIGRSAFLECDDLETVVIPQSVTSIGEQAFADSGLQSVYDLAMTPQTSASNMFGGSSDSYPIYVHTKRVEDYKSAWSQYASRIKGVDFSTGTSEGFSGFNNEISW